MSKRPTVATVATVSMEAVVRILTVINANTRVALRKNSPVIVAMRDALVEAGVIKREDRYDCTFSDFYAERDETTGLDDREDWGGSLMPTGRKG